MENKVKQEETVKKLKDDVVVGSGSEEGVINFLMQEYQARLS